MNTQPDTKDIDMALALDAAHTQKNYAQGQLAIVTRQRDELLAAVIGLVQANHEGMLTSAEWDAAATAIRHAKAEGRTE